MIYIIDNGRGYEDAQVHFVEAPASFEAWWVDEYMPWQKSIKWNPQRDKPAYSLIGVADTIRFHDDQQEDFARFVDENLFEVVDVQGQRKRNRPPTYEP